MQGALATGSFKVAACSRMVADKSKSKALLEQTELSGTSGPKRRPVLSNAGWRVLRSHLFDGRKLGSIGFQTHLGRTRTTAPFRLIKEGAKLNRTGQQGPVAPDGNVVCAAS